MGMCSLPAGPDIQLCLKLLFSIIVPANSKTLMRLRRLTQEGLDGGLTISD